MQGLEVAAADEFIFNALNGEATLTPLVHGVWNTQADEGTAYPIVVNQMLSGIHYAAVGAVRIWANLVYLIKVIGETADYSSLSAAVARIDALLHRASGTAADGTVWACVREQVIRMPDSVENRQYRH